MTDRTDDLASTLLELARRQPDEPALSAPGRAPMSFAALGARIERTRAVLAGWGIAGGDVVAWPVVDRPTAAAALAILPAGCTVAPLDARASAAALTETLRRLRAKAIVLPGGDDGFTTLARTLDLSVITARDDGSGLAGAFDLTLARRTVSLEQTATLPAGVAVIGATSGSTGRPKLVAHGGRQILASARAMARRLAIGPGEVSGHVSPLHLAGGIRNAYLHVVANGGSAEILPEMSASALLGAIIGGRVSYVSASFALFREILARLEGEASWSRGRLRFVRIASGRLEPAETRRLEALLRVPVVTGLSSSEAGSMTHQRLPPAPRSEGSVGPPLDSELRLLDEAGREVARGDIGEIVVRGPQVFDGYLDDDALNARAFVSGWFRTGDLGRFDAAGELHVVGRVKDVINRGGDKISPAEIDSVLLDISGIADAASFGVPHARLGEEVVAAIVPDAATPVDEATVKRHVSERLGPRRAPRRVVVVDAIPRNAAGKVDRRELVRRYGAPVEFDTGPGDGSRTCTPVDAAVLALWRATAGVGRGGGDANDLRARIRPDLAAELADRARAAFDVDLPPEAIVAETTVGEFAQAVDRALRAATHATGSLDDVPDQVGGGL